MSCSWLIHAHTRPDVSRCFFSDTCPCRLSLIMFFNLSVVLSLASSAPTPHIRHRSIHTYDIGTSFTHEIGDFRFRFCTLFVDVVRARIPPPARRRRGTPGVDRPRPRGTRPLCSRSVVLHAYVGDTRDVRLHILYIPATRPATQTIAGPRRGRGDLTQHLTDRISDRATDSVPSVFVRRDYELCLATTVKVSKTGDHEPMRTN